MGSSYYGDLGLGSGRSSSSRKGKKSSSEKPKQPQRGLGVAQLEKIRLQDQMAEYLPSSLRSPFHSNLRTEDDMRVDMAFSSSPSSSNMVDSSSSVVSFHPQNMMNCGDTERRHIPHGEFPPSPPSRPFSNHNNTFLPHHYALSTTPAQPFWKETTENSMQKKIRHDDQNCLTGSTSQHSDSSDTQEIDLELRL